MKARIKWSFEFSLLELTMSDLYMHDRQSVISQQDTIGRDHKDWPG